ncbi:hypothetical protein PRZ48_014492 [Zasmidium cellare]|uniref:Zn(2)-C6 fungal-type domain-containing protein n=1 Tax=Zasmidium cellare TaxID=395010 RepID=A0ABR0DYG0_ZASCE|nr:hypothetical protein PRZ48_014492 [Zasmidium cellare]
MSGVAVAAAPLGPPFYEPVRQTQAFTAPPSTLPSATVTSTDTSRALPPVQTNIPTASTSDPSSASSARPSSSKGGRKSKAHVASACINCKRAHLSCDVNRPCARCVASGKQDTCFDVQHKKRGRPRLREEGEFKVEQMLPEPGASSAGPLGGPDLSTRPIASTRHRRQESFRSLRSQGSDGSGIASSPTYPYPPPPTATQATFGFHYPPPPSITPGYEVPTAYLDLDFIILKANQSYRQIMAAGQEVAGRQLSDIAAPADGETFQNIRNRLRVERDNRDPAYMPPINQPGQDPLQGAVEADVERYTQGFDDNTYTWSQTQLGPAAQTFPARVRLAKANAYFVAVTLPSFRPVDQPPSAPPPILTRIPQPLVPGLQTQTPESYVSPARQMATQSAPPTGYVTFQGAVVPSQPAPRSAGQTASSRTFPGTQPSMSYQQPQPPPAYTPFQPATGTARLPVAEPPTDTNPFTPRSTHRELPPPGTPDRAGIQLPPIVASPAPAAGPPAQTLAGPSEPRPPTQQGETSEAEVDDDGRPESSRKRQRMGIDDVLHR